MVTDQVLRIALWSILAIGVLDVVLGAAWVLHDLIPDSERPWFSPTWSLLHVWFAFQGALALIVLAAVPFAMVSGGKLSAWLVVGLTVFQNVVFIAVASVLVFVIYRANRRAVGLSWLPTWRQLVFGVAGGFALLLVGEGMGRLSQWGFAMLLSPAHYKALVDATKLVTPGSLLPKNEVLASPLLFAAIVFAVGILTPFGEEFMFRALLHRSARFRFGAFWGTALSGSLFALVHAGPLLVVAILPLGILLGVAYDRTRSLWVPIIMHAVNNTVGVIAMYYIPWMN